MLNAFKNPFAPSAEGIRICDAYAFPTATYHSRGTVSIVSPSGTNAGSIFITGHPMLSYIDLSNSNFTSTLFTGSTSMTAFTSNTAIFSACTPASIALLTSTYRVTCAGFRIRVTMPELNRTGRLMVAPVPLARDLPGWNILNNQPMLSTSAAAVRLVAGIAVGTANSASVLNIPGAFEISINDLAIKDLSLLPKPTSPNYEVFHTPYTGGSYSASYNAGDNSATNSIGNVVTNDINDVLDMSGLSGFLIHFEGIPNSTTPVFDLEYIYHIEGTPQVSISTGTMVPSGALSAVSNTKAFEAALDTISRMPYANMIEAGFNGISLLGRMATRL